MARGPTSDERSVLPVPEPRVRGERVFLRELSQYLHTDYAKLRQFAKRRGLLHHDNGPRHLPVFWVTPATAARIIVLARTIHGEQAFQGKDFGTLVEQRRHATAQFRERRRAKRRAERDSRDGRLAFAGSGTKDDP